MGQAYGTTFTSSLSMNRNYFLTCHFMFSRRNIDPSEKHETWTWASIKLSVMIWDAVVCGCVWWSPHPEESSTHSGIVDWCNTLISQEVMCWGFSKPPLKTLQYQQANCKGDIQSILDKISSMFSTLWSIFPPLFTFQLNNSCNWKTLCFCFSSSLWSCCYCCCCWWNTWTDKSSGYRLVLGET